MRLTRVEWKRGGSPGRATSVVLALAATMALVGAACTPPTPPPGTDVVLLASQQPGGSANYQNLIVPNDSGEEGFGAAFVDVQSPESVYVSVARPFWSTDFWSIECTGPSTDNGDGSFSCPSELVYVRGVGVHLHRYDGQGLLTTWPDAEPRFAAYVGTTSYTRTYAPFGAIIVDPTRVGQTWIEQLRFQDGDDSVDGWPFTPPIPW